MALSRRSRNEIGELLRDHAIRVDHATVGVLSDPPMAAWVPAMNVPRRASRTASCNTTAANSRLEELVSLPFGFASEIMTSFVMSLGH